MQFEILHKTLYKYQVSATEAHLELRLSPLILPTQQILEHSLIVSPEAEMSTYNDYFGNLTHSYSIVGKHKQMLITNKLFVQTTAPIFAEELLSIPLQELRSIFHSRLSEVFDYLQSTEAVPTKGQATLWADRYLEPKYTLKQALEALNTAVHGHFQYVPGSTDNATPLTNVWKQRKGVCQDFAQIMLSVLRTGGIPCRYVCGYIESDPPKTRSGKRLIGSLATHAWVEVLLPDGAWIAIDPTNKCWCTEQHVAISVGRDFKDAAPVRGTFKASGKQTLKVSVRVRPCKG